MVDVSLDSESPFEEHNRRRLRHKMCVKLQWHGNIEASAIQNPATTARQ